MAWWAEQWGLGEPLLNFDAALLAKMTAALNVWEAVRGGDTAENLAQWSRDNPGLARIHAMAREWR